MYSSSTTTSSHIAHTPRRVKPLPKRQRTGSTSSCTPSNKHPYSSSASPHFNSNTHTFNSLPLPLPQNLSDLRSLPLNANLSPTPPVPSLLPLSDELLAQWRDYCLPLLGSAADALLSAGGLGGQVYSGGRSGNPTSATGGAERANPTGGEDSNVPNPLFPFSQLTPQVASQLTAQLESFVSLASAAVGAAAASGGTGGGGQPESSANSTNTNTTASSGGPPSSSSPTQAPGLAHSQLDPVTAAAYFTHHLNASLRAAGLTGPFPPSAPPAPSAVSRSDSFHSRPKDMGGDKGRAPNGTSMTQPPSQDHWTLELDEVSSGAGESSRDYREDELDDRDDRDDDRANGRNNTKKRKVPGLFPRSGVMNGDGTEQVVSGYGVNGLPIDIRGVVDTEGSRVREIEYTGELGRGIRGVMGGESRKSRVKPTMSRVTMAGIQHKTRKRQLASVLLRGVTENAPPPNKVSTVTGVQNGDAKEVVKPRTGSVSTELALDQMLSDLTGLGLYSYPSLGLPPGVGIGTSLTEKPKVKVKLSKRRGVRMARKAASEKEEQDGSGKEMGGKSSGKANKENDVPPPASGTGKKKKGKGSGARVEPPRDVAGAKDGGSGERGIFVPKSMFTFTCRSVTSERLQATKEEVKHLRHRLETELARQTAKLAEEAKLRANESGADGRGGKKRVTSIAANLSTSTATTTSNVDSASQPPTPSKNVTKKKKKKRSALANASNPHHLRNYVPSRVPGAGNANTQQSNVNVNDTNELGPIPVQFLSAEIRPKKRGGKSDSNTSVSSASNVNLTNPTEEWICAFCEYELFYGDDADFRKSVRKRKAILRRRKRARENAADKASGEASRRVKERQKELEKEQMNQQVQSTSTNQPQVPPSNPNDPESEGYDEDEYDQEDEDEEDSVDK